MKYKQYENIDDTKFIEICKSSNSMAEAARNTNMPFNTFKAKAKKLNVYDTNQGLKYKPKEHLVKYDLNDILQNKVFARSGKVKELLYKHNLKKEICEECNITNEWNDKKLVLHLDHIDGNNRNNNLDNLRILCPNCHSQTATYCRKKKAKEKERKSIYGTKEDYFCEMNKQYENIEIVKIDLVLNSNIDFSRQGWVSKVAKIIDKQPQKVNGWMKRFMNDFYEENCFKRK